jgi:hypothetical protein
VLVVSMFHVKAVVVAGGGLVGKQANCILSLPDS